MIKKINRCLAVFIAGLFLLAPGFVPADESAKEQDSAQVMSTFANEQAKASDVVAIADKTKRQVMFLMGIPLLVLLIATAVLGIAMGVYGKRVFVAHMLCAGLSLTLALAHAVVGVVWFYPF